MKPSLVAVPNKRPVARCADPASPAVSVVIPTCGRRALLRRCLDAVLAQELDGASFEVIVVDDGHDSETLHMIRELQNEPVAEGDRPAPDILYLRPRSGRGPAVARNRGWRNARAELIAFTDDDTVPQPGWLASGLATMAQAPAWSAACGRVVVPRASPKHGPTDHESTTLPALAAEGKLYAYRHAGLWLTVNTPKDLRVADDHLRANPDWLTEAART